MLEDPKTQLLYEEVEPLKLYPVSSVPVGQVWNKKKDEDRLICNGSWTLRVLFVVTSWELHQLFLFFQVVIKGTADSTLWRGTKKDTAKSNRICSKHFKKTSVDNLEIYLMLPMNRLLAFMSDFMTIFYVWLMWQVWEVFLIYRQVSRCIVLSSHYIKTWHFIRFVTTINP